MSNEHRERIRLYDRMRVASKCLEFKVKKQEERLGNRDRQAKSQGKKAMKIPKANDEFENLVQKICKVAKTSPKKSKYFSEIICFGRFLSQCQI